MGDPPTTAPIRVALRIVDGPGPAYLNAAAEAVIRVPGAEVVLVLAVRPVRPKRSRRRRILDLIDGGYVGLERRALRGGPSALSPRRSVLLPGGIPVERDGGPKTQVDALQAAGVEVLIDLAAEDDRVPLPVPPAGRWRLSYAVGVGGVRRARLARPRGSPGLAESLLEIETESGDGFETGSGISALRGVGFSRDRDAVLWRSSLLPARRLGRLVAGETVPWVGLDARPRRPPGRRPPERPGRGLRSSGWSPRCSRRSSNGPSSGRAGSSSFVAASRTRRHPAIWRGSSRSSRRRAGSMPTRS